MLVIFLYVVSSHAFRTVNICQSVSSFSVTSSGLSSFLQRVYFKSCVPPTSLLCQQHRCFFWRKWKNSYSVVRPTTVQPAYGVPKVSNLLPQNSTRKFFKKKKKRPKCQVSITIKNGSKICFIAETFPWNINQVSHPSYLFCLTVAHCETRLCRKQTGARLA